MTASKESTEIVHRTREDLAAPSASSMFEVIERAARDPTVDVNKLERLLAMKEKIDADERKRVFKAALAELQGEVPQIDKSGRILNRDNSVRNRYAKLEDLDVAVRPLLKKYGFSFSFDSSVNPKGDYVFSCELSHRDGHSDTKTLTLPVDEGQSRNRVQSIGSSETYAKRRLIKMHLNIVERDEDDDGNGGSDPVTKEQADELGARLKAAGGDAARFLKLMGSESFEAILARDYARAVAFIEEKERANKERARKASGPTNATVAHGDHVECQCGAVVSSTGAGAVVECASCKRVYRFAP